MVARFLDTEEVTGSNPVSPTSTNRRSEAGSRELGPAPCHLCADSLAQQPGDRTGHRSCLRRDRRDPHLPDPTGPRRLSAVGVVHEFDLDDRPCDRARRSGQGGSSGRSWSSSSSGCTRGPSGRCGSVGAGRGRVRKRLIPTLRTFLRVGRHLSPSSCVRRHSWQLRDTTPPHPPPGHWQR